ncbi:LysR family transcriptional regulator [Curtobacterium sp. MCPF17_047]|uniref:LysR family transcriptional regulator n=1 Tax=unclassified Curtobacterium TaxID=257496 RepID=UPI000DAA862C|nr:MULTISPECIES: LysR family transcriptional regulator [unclassified Curtobacterium]PZE63111.1 LysR family transcriptional regulator [Curtobacterium sp. MCPF17_001]PZF69245.1 LysR family transcriptional regulator [Curtobacterium sp. MCPF17_047]
MNVELRHLRAFLMVGRHRSFTRAAEQLFVTQPALTRTIKQLEQLLEVRLLDRDTRHVGLTVAGTRFYEQAESAVAAVDRAVSSARSALPLRLAFTWLLPTPWAQDAIAEYERLGEGPVTLVRTDEPIDALLRGDVDVAVLRDPRDVPAGVRVLPILKEQRVLICSTRADLPRDQPVPWAALDRHPFVFNATTGTVGPWSWTAGSGPATFVETANYDEWLETIAAGRGIGVVSSLAAQRTIHPTIRFVPLVDAPLSSVSLGFVLGDRDQMKRRFVAASTKAATS